MIDVSVIYYIIVYLQTLYNYVHILFSYTIPTYIPLQFEGGWSNWILRQLIFELGQLYSKILAHCVKFSTALANKEAIAVEIQSILPS